MLCLGRKIHQRLFIDVHGVRIVVQIQQYDRGTVRVGIEAPREAVVTREEVARQLNRQQLPGGLLP